MLHNNSLYPALRRFEEAGAVTKISEPQASRPPRLVYTLTDVGRDLLHDMLADLPAEQAGEESEFMARLASSLRSIQPNGPGSSPPAPAPSATSWRTTRRCAPWRPNTASDGARWLPTS